MDAKNMHIVTIGLRQSSAQLEFVFKDFVRANQFVAAIEAARKKSESLEAQDGDDWVSNLTDDYSRRFSFLAEEIGYIVMADVKPIQEAGIELQILRTKAGIEAQQKLAADPKVRLLMAQSGTFGTGNG